MSTIPPYNEKELLLRVARGDEGAFKVVFDLFQPRLTYYIEGIVKLKEVAEEVVTDVFLKLWTGRELVSEIENLNAFLFKIAYHKSIDFLRSAHKDRQLVHLLAEHAELAGHQEADERILQQQLEQKLREAIGLLSPQRKLVYIMSRERGLSQQQIAEQLALSPKTVNNHIVESQRFIRKYLAQHVDLCVLLLAIGRI